MRKTALLLVFSAFLSGCFLSPKWRQRRREVLAQRRADHAAQLEYERRYQAALREQCLRDPIACEALRANERAADRARKAAAMRAVGEGLQRASQPAPPRNVTCTSYGATTNCRSY